MGQIVRRDRPNGFGPEPNFENSCRWRIKYKQQCEAPRVGERGTVEGNVGSPERRSMSGVANPSSQDEDKKPNDQSGHINLKVKGQVRSFT